MSSSPGTPAEVASLVGRILDEVERAVVGKRAVAELVVVGLLAGGHVLIEDVPGVAKTLLARSICEATGLSFSRIQFTPDLMPSDVTGSSFYDARSGRLEFRAGPVFANLVLADEINRTPPKTQSALLEAMQERQVTADGETHPLPIPFAVIATENPIEHEGTYPLPEAQLDRFLLSVSIGYPDEADEQELVVRRAARGSEAAGLRAVTDRAGVVAMQQVVEAVTIDDAVASYLVRVVRSTRGASGVLVGASPRAAVGLLQVARARAAVRGRSYVLPDDVKQLAAPCLAHRLVLKPELWLRGVRPEQVVRDLVGSVAVPIALESESAATGELESAESLSAEDR